MGYLYSFIFKTLHDKFCNTTGILSDPGLKIWICCTTAMSLQKHCLSETQLMHLPGFPIEPPSWLIWSLSNSYSIVYLSFLTLFLLPN